MRRGRISVPSLSREAKLGLILAAGLAGLAGFYGVTHSGEIEAFLKPEPNRIELVGPNPWQDLEAVDGGGFQQPERVVVGSCLPGWTPYIVEEGDGLFAICRGFLPEEANLRPCVNAVTDSSGEPIYDPKGTRYLQIGEEVCIPPAE